MITYSVLIKDSGILDLLLEYMAILALWKLCQGYHVGAQLFFSAIWGSKLSGSGCTSRYTSGTTPGYTSGTTSGYSSDTTHGYTSGTTSGYTSGTTSGYTSGTTSGYTSGTTSGYTSGTTSGYTSGTEKLWTHRNMHTCIHFSIKCQTIHAQTDRQTDNIQFLVWQVHRTFA